MVQGGEDPRSLRPVSLAEASLIRKLGRRKERDRTGLTVAEGVRCAGEALRAQGEIRLAVLSPRLGKAPGGPALVETLGKQGVKCAGATDRELTESSNTTTPQGALLIYAHTTPGIEDMPDRARLLVMDGVQDPGNVGTLVRSAHAFGLDAVVALQGTADPWSPRSVRASAGSAFHVPIVVTTADELVDWAGRRGVGLKVAEAGRGKGSIPEPETSVGSEQVAEQEEEGEGGQIGAVGWALVIGNEGAGVSELVRGAANATASIDIQGAESLNAGVAGSILMYEYTKRGGAV